MNRGCGWLAAGIFSVVASLCGGAMIRQAALRAVDHGRRRPEEVSGQLDALNCFGCLTTLLFLGGLLAVVVGIVVLIVDGGRQDYYLPPDPYRPPPPTPAAAEEENRRLREEVERLRRVNGSNTSEVPSSLDAVFGDALRQRQMRAGSEGKPPDCGGSSTTPGTSPE